MKRFYREAGLVREGGGWRVTLDGRGIKTPLGQPQIVPCAALAKALAREWADQGDEIDPAAFVLRDLADFAIDSAATRPAVIAALLRFAETDTLCYRAGNDAALLRRQNELWEPLLAEAEARYGLHFERVCGVTPRPQPPPTLARLKKELERLDPFALAALNTLASLAGSLVTGLAALNGEAEAEALWAAANLEEDWQAERWGRDAEAEAARAVRFAAFSAAVDFARLARG